MKTYVVYHQNCFDGFCSAWIANKALADQNPTFIPALYGDPLPDFEIGSSIYILDFSYPKEALQNINFLAKKLVVLDHHHTAQQNLEGLDFCTFDMSKSGAGLTWDHFYPTALRPKFVDYTEDRDLWRFALPYSKEVFAWVSSFPMKFGVWDMLVEELEDTRGLETASEEGEAILRAHNQQIERACAEALEIDIAGHVVPAVNVPYTMGSDCGARLLELYPNAPFSAYYFMTGKGEQQWGLRGRSTDDFDVSQVAKLYGGGGHKKASGFMKGRQTRG